MTKKSTYQLTKTERQHRTFSENFKREKVREIELGRTKVSEISKQYEVTATNVYRWIAKFATMKDKKERLIVESQSDTKELLALKKKIADLERIIGQKQILLEFKDKMIDIAEEMYGVDIKKKLSIKPSANTGPNEDKTPSV